MVLQTNNMCAHRTCSFIIDLFLVNYVIFGIAIPCQNVIYHYMYLDLF